MEKIVECQRCHKAYKPNNYEVCNECIDQLDVAIEQEEAEELEYAMREEAEVS